MLYNHIVKPWFVLVAKRIFLRRLEGVKTKMTCSSIKLHKPFIKTSTYQSFLQPMLCGVGIDLQLRHLFLQSIFLSRASSQLSSQLTFLLPQLDVVLTQPVEALLQLLQNNRSLSISITVLYRREHVTWKRWQQCAHKTFLVLTCCIWNRKNSWVIDAPFKLFFLTGIWGSLKSILETRHK